MNVSKGILFSHATGNANSKAAVVGFLEQGLLQKFYTTIATYDSNIFGMLSKISILSEFNRRRFDKRLKDFTVSLPFNELGRQLATALKWYSLIRHEQSTFSIDKVLKALDRGIAHALSNSTIELPAAVYAYEDGAFASFRAAKERKITCLYDLPIGYWRAAKELLEEELERWPEWAATMPTFADSPEKLAQKDAELKLADHIFVASSFTAQTLQAYPGKLAPISIIPYGFPGINCVQRDYYTGKAGPLKLLFVGGLSQRKGIANQFAAMSHFGNEVTLTVVGNRPSTPCEALDSELTKHRYIPSLPHHAILQLMREHDVLVFPSLFEGFGLVITEAMSQGTPVITTNRTVGPDIIVHGENGWLVEAGSTESIVQAIDFLISHPEEVRKCGEAGIKTAAGRSWNQYGAALADKAGTILHGIFSANKKLQENQI